MQYQCPAEAQRSSYKETGEHRGLHWFWGSEWGHEKQMLLEEAVTPNCKAVTWLMPPLATPGCPSVAVGHPNPQSALLQWSCLWHTLGCSLVTGTEYLSSAELLSHSSQNLANIKKIAIVKKNLVFVFTGKSWIYTIKNRVWTRVFWQQGVQGKPNCWKHCLGILSQTATDQVCGSL